MSILRNLLFMILGVIAFLGYLEFLGTKCVEVGSTSPFDRHGSYVCQIPRSW